jgi:hypothetical protein
VGRSSRPVAVCRGVENGAGSGVDLLAPLAQDLAEWRLLCGRPDDRALIIPMVDGDEWERDDWQNWRRRVYRPAALAAGVTAECGRTGYAARGTSRSSNRADADGPALREHVAFYLQIRL